ncbi:MAG: haloacid dehalogenase-like hydrolase [Bacteroidales bacterium]|nr:MAG: hypothetical protein F082_1340 [bacterium F082]KWW29217.1 MAG: hypothetical protein AUK64_1249 [bacterium P201]MBR0538998.1 haloacid dehalogenase-like hydrolase [Bacteroidales bacterium]
MPKKKPIVALIYDFDGTLSPLNMQEYDFLKAIGIKNKAAFWKENNELIKEHEASNILCYMKLMIDKARAAKVSIKREQFVNFGKSIELYKGVEEWFDLINQIGKEEGVTIQHFINSSGLKEMIEGTKIGKKFKQIYACSFMYEDGVAVWPAVAVDFTTKTQFLFMINKGISSITENYKVNQYIEESMRPIPFNQMIYFGDGETDIPCMKLIKQQGGNSIAVYKPRDKKKKKGAEKLVHDRRVNFACAADYTKGGEIYTIVESIIKQIKNNFDFAQLQEKNRKKFDKEE